MTDQPSNSPEATRLIAAARDAARHSHSPYSGYGVGAALLLADGSIITGTNFENASYGLTLCAETVALGTANAAGKLRQIRAIAVTGGLKDEDGVIHGSDTCYPCGRCRQLINEAAHLSGVDLPVHCTAAEGDAVHTLTISELLPHDFGPKDLGLV